MSEDFPETWRYVPLKLTRDRTKWVNAIPYRQMARDNKLGDFHGVDVDGNVHFQRETLPAGDALVGGIASLTEIDGLGVGIFMRDSTPALVIIDCDSDVEVVTENGFARLEQRRGRDQLLTLFQAFGEAVPPCPVVRGNREGHGYLIFKQNARYPVRSRKIRPFGLQFDVLGNGHQNHWTLGNRALIAGRELLNDPPELPDWFARWVLRDKPETPRVERGSLVEMTGDNEWGKMFLEAVLAPVTPHGPGWNQNLFNAACTLTESGVPWEQLVNLIIERCEPNTSTDRMIAENSIASAWRKVTGEAVPE